ncbi:unnamed protein product [Zymoseptoria tritici ST99CH_3D7]|uniref:Uncharacterized protein n=1 Tax=Zymoseptoria tritici (strain ST99CH_3D7) TaxID=1276538 RepID=A0A1X7RF12_ZYMT9|nr:unnamed protein product [Zymoseptoria tritici ST99CH_3D7]
MRSSIYLLPALAVAFSNANIGDPCDYKGIQGSCQEARNCTKGFVLGDICSTEPTVLSCCIAKPSSELSPRWDSSQVDVVFWIKAFIPKDVADVTHPWPKHPGETMLSGLWQWLEWLPKSGGCFATDQRTFASSISASARMHSQASVSISAKKYTWSHIHRCGQTLKVDCDDGKVKKRGTASTKDMKFTLKSGSTKKVVLNYVGTANNPLVIAPNIDVVGTLTIDRVKKLVKFEGKVDEFPAFEAYATLNGFGPYLVAKIGPKKGAGPESLKGGANRKFAGTIYI